MISEIKGLESLRELRILNLRVNHITKLAGLENLSKLDTILLNYNQITDFESLEHLKDLYITDTYSQKRVD
ncbi:unnamed protein product [marine sediment metagenome]|uniref:Leucine-rich repeat domain-containing protein n=1 Tax=marine sediment metagenome TaxID=412755 RepID=X1DCP4_9ZZZZ